MAEMVDQKLFTQEELIVMRDVAENGANEDDFKWTLAPDDCRVLVQMVRRLALRISQLEELVEANGS